MNHLPEQRWQDLGSLEEVFDNGSVVRAAKELWPNSFKVAADFWRAPFESKHLSPRLKELILLAMHASASTLFADSVKRHVDRALAAGATKKDVVDVLISIIAVANHALYFSVPILEEELRAAGVPDGALPPLDPNYEAAKQHFMEVRGFWNTEREPLARLIPVYFTALTNLGTESWEQGSLDRRERELICIGIDCTITHSYAPGLRIHIRNALRCGATRDDILEVFQLAGLMGINTFVMGIEALFMDRELGVPRRTLGDQL